MTRFQFLSAAFLVLAVFARAELKVDPMFSDYMVLQRDMAVPIWGTADAGEAVTVQFRDQSKSAAADESGKWIVRFDAMQVGEASDVKVSGNGGETKFLDVLVGEVWLGSGQSNMAGGVGGYAKKDAVLTKMVADGPYPQLRLYGRGGWKVADEAAMRGFSAIHFAFGLSLQKELGVPVGLMVGAVGGTPSGRWMSFEMAEANADLMTQLKEKGGFSSFDDLRTAREANLAKWKAEAEALKAAGKKSGRFGGPQLLGDLYERFILPKVPYGIRGVLWDQGESKTKVPGVNQFTAMRALIEGWRGAWGQGDFPFLHVQKPSGGGAAWDPGNPVNLGAKPFDPKLPGANGFSPAALAYQLDHIKMAAITNAPLVPAVDLGTGIHPANKSGYGVRASWVALGAVYGRKVAISGPTYQSHTVENGKIRVSFDHVGLGLAMRHAETLRGFEIAGEDGKWAWADAAIEGETVVLSSGDVPMPVHVQYAFNRVQNFANLYNKDGLPALMFTSVKWEK